MIAPETVLVFGLESVSYERSRRIDRWVLREISAPVFSVKITKVNNTHISNIFRILGIMETSVSNILVKHIEKTLFQYFQDMRYQKKKRFPIVLGYEEIEKLRFPIFPGLWRMLQTSISNISRIGIINSQSWSI